MIARTIRIFIFILFSLIPFSCLKEKLGEKCETTFYSTTIKPILIAKCANNQDCHVSNGAAPVDLTKYNEVFKSKDEILRRISLDINEGDFMPQGADPVSDADFKMLKEWVAKGAEGCD